MNIKTGIKNIVVAIFMTPVLIIALILYVPFIALILYVPYALCRGLTDGFIFNDYFNFWERFSDFLLYPITYIGKWKTRCNTLKGKLQYYKDRCKELENELNKED